MREVAERRQQLELEHEQALAILKFKQDEIKRLQRVRDAASVVLHTLEGGAKGVLTAKCKGGVALNSLVKLGDHSQLSVDVNVSKRI